MSASYRSSRRSAYGSAAPDRSKAVPSRYRTGPGVPKFIELNEAIARPLVWWLRGDLDARPRPRREAQAVGGVDHLFRRRRCDHGMGRNLKTRCRFDQQRRLGVAPVERGLRHLGDAHAVLGAHLQHQHAPIDPLQEALGRVLDGVIPALTLAVGQPIGRLVEVAPALRLAGAGTAMPAAQRAFDLMHRGRFRSASRERAQSRWPQ
jgi:hypothetical protein